MRLLPSKFRWHVLTGGETDQKTGQDPGRNRGIFLRKLMTLAGLFALWLLLSGLFKPLLIGFGLASVLVVGLLTSRMDAQDRDHLDIKLSPFGLARYLLWLMAEIAKANWSVTKIILSPDMPVRQHLFKVPFSQKTDLGQVIFANSITLTPGTITVETEREGFLVHAVAYSEDDPEALAEMDRRVTATESRGAG